MRRRVSLIAGFNKVTSLGFNIATDTSGALTAPGDQQGVDPLPGTLQNNAGPTHTFALLLASPARDAGDCVDATGSVNAIDQRGHVRPGAGCDIGAVEMFVPPSQEGQILQAVNDALEAVFTRATEESVNEIGASVAGVSGIVSSIEGSLGGVAKESSVQQVIANAAKESSVQQLLASRLERASAAAQQ